MFQLLLFPVEDTCSFQLLHLRTACQNQESKDLKNLTLDLAFCFVLQRNAAAEKGDLTYHACPRADPGAGSPTSEYERLARTKHLWDIRQLHPHPHVGSWRTAASIHLCCCCSEQKLHGLPINPLLTSTNTARWLAVLSAQPRARTLTARQPALLLTAVNIKRKLSFQLLLRAQQS